MTKQEKQETGSKRAEKDFGTIKTVYDDFRIIGNPYKGRWSCPRKISLLLNKKKVGEIDYGYSSIEDEAYFNRMLELVKRGK